MKTYHYQGRDMKGVRVSGDVEANSDRQAVSILKDKGVVITGIDEKEEEGLFSFLAVWQKPKSEDVVNFTRQLATMSSSGLSLVESLRILVGQSRPAMAKVVTKILQGVEGGVSLSKSIMESGGDFGPVYTSLVAAGETVGALDTILKKLADTLDKQRDFRNKTKGALVYPAIIIVGMIVVTFIMMIFVIPQMTQMYKDFGTELPLPTRILMSISDFTVKFWYLIVGFVFLLLAAFRRWSKSDLGSLLIEQIMFKIPIWGKLKKDIILAEFSRTMGLLVTAGISVLDGMRIVADTLGSKIYAEEVRRAAALVEKGVSMTDSVQTIEGFPPILGQMVAVGEQTGKLDEVLTKLAEYYEEESAIKVKSLTTAIEPLVMVVMGIGVGFLVIAVIMPIYNLTSQF